MVEKSTCKITKRCLEENIGFFDFVQADGYIWVAAINYNALFKIDLQTKVPHYVGSFPGESMYQTWLYRSVVRVGDRLIFAPFMAESIGEYDLEKECFIEHEKLNNSGTKFKFESLFCKEEEVFFVPQRYPYMVVYHTAKNQIAYESCLQKALEEDDRDNGAVSWGVGTTEDENCIYLPQRAATEIVKCDLARRNAQKINIGQNDPAIICSLIDEWLWLLPAENKPVAKWNTKTGEKVVYHEWLVECEEMGAPFIRAIDCGDKICFFRELAKKTWIYDKASDTFECVEKSYQPKAGLVDKPWKGNFYFAKKINENQILAVSKKDHGVVFFDVNSMQLQSFFFYMSDADKKAWSTHALFRDCSSRTKTFMENTEDSLECFLDFLQQKK